MKHTLPLEVNSICHIDAKPQKELEGKKQIVRRHQLPNMARTRSSVNPSQIEDQNQHYLDAI